MLKKIDFITDSTKFKNFSKFYFYIKFENQY